MPCKINTKSTTIRVNGRFIIPRMGKKVLLLILHVVVFFVTAAAVVIIVIIFDVFVTSQKLGLVILNFTCPSFIMNCIYIFRIHKLELKSKIIIIRKHEAMLGVRTFSVLSCN